jgi:hypothetical protein
MAGLNIAHEALSGGSQSSSIGIRVQQLNNRIDETLAGYRQDQIH